MIYEMLGKKFGRLTVIDRSVIRNASGNIKWKCLCDCGTITYGQGCDIRSGKKRSCGCLFIESKSLLPGRAAMRSLMRRYKWNAKRDKRSFNLTEDEFKLLTSSKCHYCAGPPSQKAIYERQALKHNGNYMYNGIDRIDSRIGYTIDNCVTCCVTCNTMKMQLSLDDFKTHVSKIYEHFLG